MRIRDTMASQLRVVRIEGIAAAQLVLAPRYPKPESDAEGAAS